MFCSAVAVEVAAVVDHFNLVLISNTKIFNIDIKDNTDTDTDTDTDIDADTRS